MNMSNRKSIDFLELFKLHFSTFIILPIWLYETCFNIFFINVKRRRVVGYRALYKCRKFNWTDKNLNRFWMWDINVSQMIIKIVMFWIERSVVFSLVYSSLSQVYLKI